MKTFALGTFLAALALVGFGGAAHAQMMYGNGYGSGMMGYYGNTETSTSTATTTNAGDAAGAALWQKLSSGQVSCGSLSQSDFATLGDYVMGNMMGAYHDQTDQYMTRSLGQRGEEQMHIAMGERLSGCNPSAAYPSGVSDFYPMMGGWGPGSYSMMGFGSGVFDYSAFGGILMALVWLFAIIGVVASIMWLVRRTDK